MCRIQNNLKIQIKNFPIIFNSLKIQSEYGNDLFSLRKK